jgi:hypothetical protein
MRFNKSLKNTTIAVNRMLEDAGIGEIHRQPGLGLPEVCWLRAWSDHAARATVIEMHVMIPNTGYARWTTLKKIAPSTEIITWGHGRQELVVKRIGAFRVEESPTVEAAANMARKWLINSITNKECAPFAVTAALMSSMSKFVLFNGKSEVPQPHGKISPATRPAVKFPNPPSEVRFHKCIHGVGIFATRQFLPRELIAIIRGGRLVRCARRATMVSLRIDENL